MTIQSRVIRYLREEIEKEQAELFVKFKTNINMSYRELKTFLNTDEFLKENYNNSKSRTEIPDINKAVLRIMNKEEKDLTDNDFDWIRQIVRVVEGINTENIKGSKEFNLMSLGFDLNKKN